MTVGSKSTNPPPESTRPERTNRERAIEEIRAGVPLREALPCRNHGEGCYCLLCEWVPVIEEALHGMVQ